MAFPLKTDFFPQVRLTPEERRHYVALGEQSARALRSSMTTLEWKKVMEKDGVTYAQAHDMDSNNLNSPSSAVTAAARKVNDEPEAMASTCLLTSATAFAAGTISEALEALASPVTDDYRRVMHFLHGSCFVDGVCLHTIAGAESDNDSNNTKSNSQAFTTVKWAAFDDGKKAFNTVGSRAGTDYCFLEHSGIHCTQRSTNDVPNGSGETDLFGFSIQESITRERDVPSLAGVGLVRGRLHRTGILILPTDRPNVIQITFILQTRMAKGIANNVSGTPSSSEKISVLALARQMRRRVAAVGRLYLLLERRRLSQLEHVPRAEWVPDATRKHCVVCVKPFALRRRKHHCRHCGEVVCSSCAPARQVDLDTATPPSTANVRICTACVIQSRTGARGPGSDDVLFVHRLRDTGFMPSSRPSTTSAGSRLPPADNNKAEFKTRPQSLSSGSSTFSISSDSPISAPLTRTDAPIRLYDSKNVPLDASSRRPSRYSMSEVDAFDSLASSFRSNQDGNNWQYMRYRRSSQWRDRGRSEDANPALSTCSSDLLERIRGMRADLLRLTLSYRHFRDASSVSIGRRSAHSVTDDDDGAVREVSISSTPPRLDAQGSIQQDTTLWTRSRKCDDRNEAPSIDVISTSEHFTLLCPVTRCRPSWGPRTSSSYVRHEEMESTRTSCVSSVSNVTMAEEDEEADEESESSSTKAELAGCGVP